MKRLRIGRRRAQAAPSSPLELALAPALENGSWRVPDRFNLTRDLVEVLGRDPKRQALTILGADGIVEPRSFKQLAEGASRWASILHEKGIGAGDRVVVLSRLNEDWVDIALACIKIGAVFAPAEPTISSQALESRVAVTDAALVVAGEESEDAIARMSFAPEVHNVRSGRMRRSSDIPPPEPTADTSSRDVAYLVWTAGTEAAPKPLAHTHGSLFAARTQAEHWLDAREGDLVWCTAGPGSALAVSTILGGAWTRGAEVVIHEGDFAPAERLDLIRRVGPTVLCQSPTEYAALTELRQLARSRPPRLRRLLAAGEYVEPDVVEAFRKAWGLTIQVGYGQAETGIVSVTAPREDGEGPRAGEIGLPLPGHHLAVVDDQGNELPAGVEGDLAVRGRPPTLFVGYWESPEETKRAFRGDWYLTGDVAVAGESGLRFVARSEELITTRGRTFGPHEIERTLAAHAAVAESAVVGVRDLERGGQFVRAFVVLDKNVEGTEQLEAELRQFVGESLAEQQVPREIEFVDWLPLSSTGAVRRLELRDRPVSGRPLWEAPPTSEPEPQPPTTTELLVTPEQEAVELAHEPDVVFEPLAPAELAAPVEPVEQVLEPVADPIAHLEPELPTAFIEPQPLDEPTPHIEPSPAEGLVSPAPDEIATPPDTEPAAEDIEIIEEPVQAPEASALPLAPSIWLAPDEEQPDAHVAPLTEIPADEHIDGADFPSDVATADAPPSVFAEPVEATEVDAGSALDEATEPVPAEEAAATIDVEPEPSVEGDQPETTAVLRDAAEPRHLPEFPDVVELTPRPSENETALTEPAPEQLPDPASSSPPPEPETQAATVAPDVAPPPTDAGAPTPPEPAAETLAPTEPPIELAAAAEPTPAASPEPLPDYIVSPADAYAAIPPAPIESALEPEPEEQDLGPLPEYVVDPERRLEVVAEDAAPTPEAKPKAKAAEPAPVVDPSLEDHPLAGLARPQVSIPIPDDDPDAPKPSGRRSRGRTRSTPAADQRRKRGRSTGDPGDEGLETGWMQRLSNRLDAYGMSDEEADEQDGGVTDPGGDPKKP